MRVGLSFFQNSPLIKLLWSSSSIGTGGFVLFSGGRMPSTASRDECVGMENVVGQTEHQRFSETWRLRYARQTSSSN